MCGIFGVIGTQNAAQRIFEGLKTLEYRGYDSAGIAVLNSDGISNAKEAGKLDALKGSLVHLPDNASTGIGHTRWATHGAPTKTNAHPHMHEDVVIVHNGIIENYKELKEQLIKDGVDFQSETDSEVILHLFEKDLVSTNDVTKSISNVTSRLEGAFAIGLLWKKDPEHIYMIKQNSPVVIGLSEKSNYFASDAPALATDVKDVIFMEDGCFAKLSKEKVEVFNFDGKKKEVEIKQLQYSASDIGKQGHRHYMLKEIYEQPHILTNIVARCVDTQNYSLRSDLLLTDEFDFSGIKRIQLVGCGTAYYSGCVAKYFLESMLRIPVNVELASEFRYANPIVEKDHLIIPISQSGETLDTLTSIKMCKEFGAKILAVCNVRYSSITREADTTCYIEAGPEIGVASTKAFTSMVLNLYILGLHIGKQRGTLSKDDLHAAIDHLEKFKIDLLHSIPDEQIIQKLSDALFEKDHFLFIGRGEHAPIAYEGALKLKEISYIHAEGYAGGELKHGPIALIDRKMPILCLAPKDRHHEKMLSNIEEVKARRGIIIGAGDKDDKRLHELSDYFLPCAQNPSAALQAILSVIPLQILSYQIAVDRGTDVDQPRNLAKSVTVE